MQLIGFVFKLATKWFHKEKQSEAFAISYKEKMMRRDVFQALADPTRRAIILMLAVTAMTPNAIAEQFDISRQAVSKHIKVMSECELLTQEQKGREIYYHLQADKMKEIEKWLEQFKQLMANRFEQLDQVLIQLKQKKK